MPASNFPSRLAVRDFMVVIGCETGLIVALHLVGRYSPTVDFGSFSLWLSEADPVDVLTELARYSGLAIGYWLLGTTVANLLAGWARWETGIRALSWITLPSIGRIAHGVAAASVAGAAIVGPGASTTALALASPPSELAASNPVGGLAEQGLSTIPESEARFGLAFSMLDTLETSTDTDDAPDAADSGSYEPSAAGWTAASEVGDPEFWVPYSVGEAPSDQTPDAERTRQNAMSEDATSPATHRVAKGDNLWTISETHLRNVLGRQAAQDEVAEYWIRVVDANRDSVKSGDVNLIYPGETITLPTIS